MAVGRDERGVWRRRNTATLDAGNDWPRRLENGVRDKKEKRVCTASYLARFLFTLRALVTSKLYVLSEFVSCEASLWEEGVTNKG